MTDTTIEYRGRTDIWIAHRNGTILCVASTAEVLHHMLKARGLV